MIHMSTMFEKLFLMLYPYITNSTDMLNIVRQMEDLIFNEREAAIDQYREQYRIDKDAHAKQVHELLVKICLREPEVLRHAEHRKIQAIKHLRNVVGFPTASLKAAKEAVEDERVLNAARNLTASDQWNVDPELADHQNNYGTPDCEQ